MKTVGVGLIMALNIGTEAPDMMKPHPCAKLQCWIDPYKYKRNKAKEIIGERLEQQYSKWQLAHSKARKGGGANNNNNGGLKYRRALDPTVEDVRMLCTRLRNQARNERILIHYNGHGVPRPSNLGEIWVFDKNKTEYVPLPVSELKQWMGKPVIVVLDCNAAGVLIPFLTMAPDDTSTAGTSASVMTTGSHNNNNNNLIRSPSSTNSIFNNNSNSNSNNKNNSKSNNNNNNSNANNNNTSAYEGLAQQLKQQQQQPMSIDEQSSLWVRDTLVLCPCSENEWLPMHPDYPADIFTSCLTTPIQMALRWFVNRNQKSMQHVHPDAVDAIPGATNDRKTPLGELNWIFTAVTDSIAWNVLPKPLFTRLFRQDLLVASMFRNFFLADRILSSFNCTPISFPPLPPGTAQHPLWQAFDLACETLLFQLIQDGILGNHVLKESKRSIETNDEHRDDNTRATDDRSTSSAEDSPSTPQQPHSPSKAVTFQSGEHPPPAPLASSVSSPFFSEQLAAFEVWLEFAEIHKLRLRTGGPTALDPPEHLPVVVQVLLGVAHRVRALTLLKRFLELGPWAVNMALSLGIFPYVMKLLQSPEYKCLLVSIWASILAFDPSCRVDILKDGVVHHFVHHLMWGLNNSTVEVSIAAKERTLAAFVLAAVCYEYPAGQAECIRLNLHGSCCALLSSYEQGENAHDSAVEQYLPAHFRLWICICLGNIVKGNKATQTEAYAFGVQQHLIAHTKDKSPEVRAAVCYALGCLVEAEKKRSNRAPSSMNDLTQQLSSAVGVGSVQTGMLGQNITSTMPMSLTGQQLQLPFSQAVIPNLQLRQQTMLNSIPASQGQHMNTSTTGEMFWNQPQIHHTTTGTPYITHGSSSGFSGQTAMGGPPGFLVGSGPMLAPNGQPALVNLLQFPTHAQVPMIPMMDQHPIVEPSVYDDRACFENDLSSIEALLILIDDGSVVVRYEAIIAIGTAVAKYLDAFVLAASELSLSSIPKTTFETSEKQIINNLTLSLETVDRLKAIWIRLRSLQKHDPFPAVASAANSIVNVVHERLFRRKTDNEIVSVKANATSTRLSEICEENVGVGTDSSPTTFDRPPTGKGVVSPKKELRRVASETIHSRSLGASMEKNADANESSRGEVGGTDLSSNYSMPKSEFYAWKTKSFIFLEEPSDELDPLSPMGITRQYRERRNMVIRVHGEKLTHRYSCLAPKPPKPQKQTIEMLLEEEDEEALLAAEEEVSLRKRELEFKEERLLKNDGVKINSLLAFHPVESYLMACGDTGTATLWNTETGLRSKIFNNKNSKASRMTSSCWINPYSTSHFMIGCDDGHVRIWSDVLESSGNVSLLSAFNAVPMNAGQWGSGLITDWQPYSGTLIAGGNSKSIRCWDIESEKVTNKLETNSDAYVTTLTTAWDEDACGISKDLIVAGLSDGSLKLFDIRKNQAGSRPKLRVNSSSEHTSWVVTTAFTSYCGRYELISGTVSGEVKTWDLRMLSSLRTLNVQRSTMTTLSIHSKIPIIATGSDAQFIKIVGLDGDTMQVLRYHEKLVSHKFGPISCLAFHPYKDLLAAGATDSFIGLYSTKHQLRQKQR